MKIQKVIIIITVILLLVIIGLASFVGIYKKDEYKVSNIVPNYKLGMEFTNSRVINFEVNKEENSEEILTVENFKQSKSIIKNRLKKLGVDQYRVTLDETNGNIQVIIPENDDTELVIYNLLQSGTFELKDSETGEILIDTKSVVKSDVVYSQGETETTVYLQIKLNKEGKQKLEEISKVYVQTTTQTTNEEGETEDSTETKKVEILINGQVVAETYFGDLITDGTLNIVVGSGGDSVTVEQYATSAQEAVAILNSGILPITYTETNYIQTANITEKQKEIAIYIVLAVIALMAILFIIKLKVKGLLACVLQIGYIALLLLTLRYTNVKITIEGICGIAIGIIINYIFIYRAFRNMDLSFIKEITGKFALKLIPVYIIAVVLSFSRIANIYSLGMTLVWGIIVMYIYNLTLTQVLLNALKK